MIFPSEMINIFDNEKQHCLTLDLRGSVNALHGNLRRDHMTSMTF